MRAIPSLRGSYHSVRPGESLWGIARSYGLDVDALAEANSLSRSGRISAGEALFIPLPSESARFLWPVRGALVPKPGALQGLAIAAPAGTLVRASRSGQVAVATAQLSGWSKTVILDHLDGYLTVYSGMDEIWVSPGAELKQGIPLGRLNGQALYFEIRYGSVSKNVLALLPSE